MSNPLVSITIVTANSSRFVTRCLESVFRQTYEPLEIVVLDNASTDGTWETLRRYEDRIRRVRLAHNVGFAAGQNEAIRRSRGEWVLTLNPDARLEPDFVARLVEAGSWDDRVGVVCGKLLRATPDLRPLAERRIDSAGIYFTPSLRHFDRGWNEPDDGRYDRVEYVFGASAAAALYRREMIDDVACSDGFFDPDFFIYREDADVAWRSQWLGWRCLYVPQAVGYHVRRMVAQQRRRTPVVLRMHSVKNRFLMRIKNMTPGLRRRYALPALSRDLVILGGALLLEPGCLPAFWRAVVLRRRALEKRAEIEARRRVCDEDLAAWFSWKPVSRPFTRPAPELAPASAQPAALAWCPATAWQPVQTHRPGK